MNKYPELFFGKQVHLPNLHIGSFTIPVRDAKGKPIALSEIETVGKGDFDLSIRLAPRYNSHSGWVMKQASQMIALGGSQFKPRFMVLLEGVLTYYDNELTLEHPRATLKCSDIHTMNYGPDKNGEMTLYLSGGTEDWYIRWMDNEPLANQEAWLRKIANCCPNIKERESFRTRTSSVTAPRTASTALPVVDVKNTSKLQKRASFLFGGKK